MGTFSVQTLTALVEVVTGGAGNSPKEPIGIYRSGTTLDMFLGVAGIKLNRSRLSSRVQIVRNAVLHANEENPEAIIKLIEQVADPREYLDCPEKTEVVVGYLNVCLRIDGYELRPFKGKYKLFALGNASALTDTLAGVAKELDFDSVSADFERAITQAEQDPEDAITAACASLESVCKCILDELGVPYPPKQDIAGLAQAVEEQLNLSPGRTDIEPDIKRILGGLVNVSRGIGALRTHCGDAHGRGKKTSRVDARIARLAIHSASTVALFFIETWQRQKRVETIDEKN